MFKYRFSLLYILYTCILLYKLFTFTVLYPIFLELIVASSNPSAVCIVGEVGTTPTNVCGYLSCQTNKCSCLSRLLEFCPLKALSIFVRTLVISWDFFSKNDLVIQEAFPQN